MKTVDLFSEIYQSVKRHKVRNILTGFGVAWGIFILIILLGAGEGLRQGVLRLFSSFAKNSIWIYAGEVSKPTNNGRIGEPVLFDDNLLSLIPKRVSQVEYISPEFNYGKQVIITNEEETSIGQLKGVGKDYFNIRLLKLSQGRMFNEMDFRQERPVCIVGHQISRQLKGKKSNLIGSRINVSGQILLVIGILDEGSIFTQGEQSNIYVTTSVFRQRYRSEHTYSTIGLSLFSDAKTKNMEEQLKSFFAHKFHFHHEDDKALYISNISEQVESFDKLFKGIELFIWLMGVGLLLSGVIGIGNMLSTTVRERTSEIGIRKALGARPKSILRMILLESILLTLVSGITGLLGGYFVVSLGNFVLSNLDDNNETLIQVFSVDYSIVVQALLLLILAGCFAGLLPAKIAAEVVPVKALNHNF